MCGIVGVFNHPQASVLSYYGLHALQHRGQEASGIVSVYQEEGSGKPRFGIHKGEGLVLDVFSDHALFSTTLRGTAAIGHNRYSTTGSTSLANIQPFQFNYTGGLFALAHNGNLTNTRQLRNQLKTDGAIFQTTTDSEVFMHLIARSKKTTQIDQIRDAVQQAKGAYSLVMLSDTALYAARDPNGFRPLCIGRLTHEGGYAYVVASETCALDIISAEYVRDVEHNEIIEINEHTVRTGEITSHYIDPSMEQSSHCIFEYIYFSRPDSMIFGHPVDKVRRKLGKHLAEESPVAAPDGSKVVVIAVPDSGNTATLGYARVNEERFPTRYEIGLIRSHYIGRTFIAPGQNSREFKVKAKFNVVRGVLENNTVVVVDDSIVRGTTSRSLIHLIREAKPTSVHMRITSPPVKHPCMYGMDFPSTEELIANHYDSAEDIARQLGADSLAYLSVDGLMRAVPSQAGKGYCTACFTGTYPVEIDVSAGKMATEE
ncbi:MAG: amidophosphoribosyltransferase [Candidatus Kapaibacteriota bacterium]